MLWLGGADYVRYRRGSRLLQGNAVSAALVGGPPSARCFCLLSGRCPPIAAGRASYRWLRCVMPRTVHIRTSASVIRGALEVLQVLRRWPPNPLTCCRSAVLSQVVFWPCNSFCFALLCTRQLRAIRSEWRIVDQPCLQVWLMTRQAAPCLNLGRHGYRCRNTVAVMAVAMGKQLILPSLRRSLHEHSLAR